MSGMGCAANKIIQLTVMSRKLPLKTAESPRKRFGNFICNEKSPKNYLNQSEIENVFLKINSTHNIPQFLNRPCQEDN